MELKEYEDIKQKDAYFLRGDQVINRDVKRLLETLNKALKERNQVYAYRGCSEAKWMIYNSAQRFYINQQLYLQVDGDSPAAIQKHYSKFVSNLIEETRAWNSGTVEKLLTAMNVNIDNSLAYLSYMQHYGIPSPLVDFTTDPFIALFFAIEGLEYHSSKRQIDNYFSLYVMPIQTKLPEKMKRKFYESLHNFDDGAIPYDCLEEGELQVIETHDPAYRILNNTNIINQQGLFFYNFSAFQPLEEAYFENALRVNGNESLGAILLNAKFGTCFNVHKSLIPHIKDELALRGITRDVIFPDISKMRQSAVHGATKNAINGSQKTLDKKSERPKRLKN